MLARRYYADAMSTVPSGPPLQVTGIDLNSQMFSYAQEAAAQHGLSQRVQLQEGSLSRLPYEDGTFDAVVCTLVSGSPFHQHDTPAKRVELSHRSMRPSVERPE